MAWTVVEDLAKSTTKAFTRTSALAETASLGQIVVKTLAKPFGDHLESFGSEFTNRIILIFPSNSSRIWPKH